jgi:ferredoxin
MALLTVIDKHGKEFTHEATLGETLWDACLNAGVELAHSCGFGMQCSTCVVEVKKGHTNLSHLDEEEVKRCGMEGITLADPDNPSIGMEVTGEKACRLSCACQIFGDVIVQQPEA